MNKQIKREIDRLHKQIARLEGRARLEIFNLLVATIQSCGVVNSPWRYVRFINDHVKAHVNKNYKGREEYGDILERAVRPRTRGFAKELRDLIKSIVKKILDMEAQGYDENAANAMLRLMM